MGGGAKRMRGGRGARVRAAKSVRGAPGTAPGVRSVPFRTLCGDHDRHGEHFVTHAAVQVLCRTPETTVTGVSTTLPPKTAV